MPLPITPIFDASAVLFFLFSRTNTYLVPIQGHEISLALFWLCPTTQVLLLSLGMRCWYLVLDGRSSVSIALTDPDITFALVAELLLWHGISGSHTWAFSPYRWLSIAVWRTEACFQKIWFLSRPPLQLCIPCFFGLPMKHTANFQGFITCLPPFSCACLFVGFSLLEKPNRLFLVSPFFSPTLLTWVLQPDVLLPAFFLLPTL